MPTIVFHVSPTANRESILANGLDVAFMCERGIAGSPTAEVNGTHVNDALERRGGVNES